MTEGWLLFLLLVFLGVLAIVGVVENARGAHEERQRRPPPEPTDEMRRR